MPATARPRTIQNRLSVFSAVRMTPHQPWRAGSACRGMCFLECQVNAARRVSVSHESGSSFFRIPRKAAPRRASIAVITACSTSGCVRAVLVDGTATAASCRRNALPTSLGARQIVDCALPVALHRHGQEALAAVQELRLVHSHILEERSPTGGYNRASKGGPYARDRATRVRQKAVADRFAMSCR